ncbi:MAG: hypothetical protein COT71_01500 [Candidatus Andersenbacteria bacterium CG10_big_fil_rev_8_21_14_0_10_54_11]|uniref:Gcp-like domain-containing protein n=1 Tax=Candidatus Andersenbacteria bacterium CG10_big_fil_rev_8_21_14_0_10_54_11 TaxID=1974485 RepID=A0A2M6WZW2_9BACT|nr:MAG: hypothetical protein COT71_01500 [Candidatus Andersenbacteria bacterium CG10_big_fil_rev_8_21_14_0_10_54_11]
MHSLLFDTVGTEGVVGWYAVGGSCRAAHRFVLRPDAGRQLLTATAAFISAYGRPDLLVVRTGSARRSGALRAGVAAAHALAWAWGLPLLTLAPGASFPNPSGRQPFRPGLCRAGCEEFSGIDHK